MTDLSPMSDNPYRAPTAPIVPLASDLTLWKATCYVLGMTLSAAVVGCLLGALIGTLVPEYYRYVFRSNGDTDFHPVAIGSVLGLLQGGGIGMGLGVLLVIIYSWYSLRLVRLRMMIG